MNQKSMKIFKILLVVVCLFTLVVGCGKKEVKEKPKEEIINIEDQTADSIKYSNIKIKCTETISELTADLLNESDAGIVIQNIKMTFYDNNGNRIGETKANVSKTIMPHMPIEIKSSISKNISSVATVKFTVGAGDGTGGGQGNGTGGGANNGTGGGQGNGTGNGSTSGTGGGQGNNR